MGLLGLLGLWKCGSGGGGVWEWRVVLWEAWSPGRPPAAAPLPSHVWPTLWAPRCLGCLGPWCIHGLWDPPHHPAQICHNRPKISSRYPQDMGLRLLIPHLLHPLCLFTKRANKYWNVFSCPAAQEVTMHTGLRCPTGHVLVFMVTPAYTSRCIAKTLQEPTRTICAPSRQLSSLGCRKMTEKFGKNI